ncbi:MAG: dipeptide ABC transporter ATP-binding protein [Actinomycetia bacterium]|nr:dipeptide ABC transporter ATP-binding protein [Actinomycetes bacterium]
MLLEARDVVKHFPIRTSKGKQQLQAVDGVSLQVRKGETLGLVGESGCGKSTLGRCLVRLIDVTSGSVIYDGVDITNLSRRQLRDRRRGFQMIFQDPYASLNPRRRAAATVEEPLRTHGIGSDAEIKARALHLLEVVGFDPSYADRYPHEFSGGQRQRLGIARALALAPQLLIADEPVSALDVSIQAQVLNLLADLQEENNLTYVFIAHDLAVVHHISDRIGVMYLGELVELGDSSDVYISPRHPYTEALISAIPVIDADAEIRERIVLTGDLPNPIDKPTGCAFHPRCRYAQDLCRTEKPLLHIQNDGRQVACHFPVAAPDPPAVLPRLNDIEPPSDETH